MMKHETVTSPLVITANKEDVKRGLWKIGSSSETPTLKRPITKAFDFLPWSRSKKTAAENPSKKTNASNTANGTANALSNVEASSSSVTPVECKKNTATSLNYHGNIYRNGGGIIKEILNEKIEKDGLILKKGNMQKARQMKVRNKSLDINELKSCVEREVASPSTDGRHGVKGKRHNFLDDTFIENIMRAKESHQFNLDEEEHEGDQLKEEFRKNHYQTSVGCHDTEDEFFYQQQQELAKLCKNTDYLKCVNDSPRHILFNDKNTVYLPKKDLPVNKTIKNCAKELNHSENVLKACLKFEKLPDHNCTSANHDTKSMIMSNQVAGNNRLQSSSVSNKKCILQKQITNPEQYSTLKFCYSPDVVRKRSPSAGRYQTSGRYSHNYPRRKSLTDGVLYKQNSPSLYDNGNSSTSSMGSGASSSGGILNARSLYDKQQKKLSFREPMVTARRSSRRPSSEVFTNNVLNFQNKNDYNCDKEGHTSHTTPTFETAPTEDELQKLIRRS